MLWAGRALLFMVAIPTMLPAAWAAGQDVTERAAQAQTACLSGDHAKGVGILAELYVSTGDPDYIFNQGRCFEQNGRYEEAIVRFREFQRKNANAGRPPDPTAEEHIVDCQALLDKQKPAVPAALAAPAEPPPAIVETQPATVTPPTQTTAGPLPASGPAPTGTGANQMDLTQSAASPTEAQPEISIFARWWFWTAAAVVVAGGVTTGLLLSRGGGTTPFCPDCASIAGVNLQ